GEVTCWASGEGGFAIATKSLAPPPGKYHGLSDAEQRYRRRYVDLYANPEVLKTFELRSRIIQRVRSFLTDPPDPFGPGFLEVETPMMQPIAGGAAARPFVTHHNALDLELYLRIAPELYLKRLLVGGMHRVFEINRNFRNEGIDRSHNPEFTMLELYQAFGDYHAMMDLVEAMMRTCATEVCGSSVLPFGEWQIDYGKPFRRATYHTLFAEANGFEALDRVRVAEKAAGLGIETAGRDPDVVLNDVWEETVEKNLIQPTFVIDYPASLCPLTKSKADRPEIAERFELFVATMELANAYTELNDPDVQKANFDQQVSGLDDEEATFRTMDHDFIDALKVGMPPAGGMGIGIDRLVMLMTNHRSIRDVILFPLLRPQEE
ncbi:MAG: lysine--tRNA ligase, partial [Phycisphaeraceae bacterium]|nr:lysine--tRNA ligase [Phycisphaeraceae bacterium]